MEKDGGSESTIIIGPSVLVYALHNLENVLGLARFRVFVSKLLLLLLSLFTIANRILSSVLSERLKPFVKKVVFVSLVSDLANPQ